MIFEAQEKTSPIYLDFVKTQRHPNLHECEAYKKRLARSSFETTQLNNKKEHCKTGV